MNDLTDWHDDLNSRFRISGEDQDLTFFVNNIKDLFDQRKLPQAMLKIVEALITVHNSLAAEPSAVTTPLKAIKSWVSTLSKSGPPPIKDLVNTLSGPS
jgi:hypothetical protein